MSLSRRQFFASLARPAASRALVPEVTPAARFFRQYTHATPRLNADTWGLSIGGRVRHPLVWSYSDLLAMDAVDLPCTLVCAANPAGGERIGHAVWRGVPLAALLDELEVTSNVTYARLESAGGGRTAVTLDALRNGLLATHMNGAPLLPDQGFPARLILPGLYEHKQPRWIERIELWETPGPGGLWERRGWTADSVRTTSAFDAPRLLLAHRTPVALGGYAFAGPRRITAVEVSVDGGAWMPVEVGPSAPNIWTRWRASWPAPGPGDYQLRVRATDETGVVQAEDGAPFPNGSSAVHAITVRLSGAAFA